MRTRLLPLLALAACLILPAPASAWQVLDPIFPSGSPVKYPKGLALDTSGAQPGVWLTDVGHFSNSDSVYKFALTPSPPGGSDPLTILPPQLQWENGTDVAGKTAYPGGVAVDPATHNVFIADSDNDRILRVNPAGRVTAITPAALVDYPHGLAVHDGSLFVAEPAKHRISRLNLDLTAKLGTPFTSAGFKSGPAVIAIDPASGEIWAPDEGYRGGAANGHPEDDADGVLPSDHGRVVQLSATGDTLRVITDGSFGQLYSDALDTAAGRLYVGDYTQDLIRVFGTASGQQVDTIPSSAFARAFVTPVGMEIDPATRILYAADVGTDPFHNPFNPSIQRIQLDPLPGTGAPPAPTPAAPAKARARLGRARLHARFTHGRERVRVTGSIAVLGAHGRLLAAGLCSGRVRIELGRSATSARSHPLASRAVRLTGAKCRVPVVLSFSARRVPRSVAIVVSHPGGERLAAFSGSVRLSLR